MANNIDDKIEPGSQNKVNWNFGSLLLVLRDDDREAQKRLLRGFHSVAIGIARKKGWFHPGGVNEWCSIVNAATIEQVQRYRDWSRADIEAFRAVNGFAYFYRALESRLIDEIRRLWRYSREVMLPYEAALFSSLPDSAMHPDKSLQRQGVLRLLECCQIRSDPGDRAKEILLQSSLMLRDPSLIGAEDYRAEIVRRLSHRFQVTPQQARKDLVRFQETAKTNPVLIEIREELRSTIRLGEQTLPARQRQDNTP